MCTTSILRVAALCEAAILCPQTAGMEIARDVAINSALSSGASKSVDLSRFVPMATCQDLWRAHLVTIALGILISEVTHSTSWRNGNPANGNHLEICLLSSRKNRNSLTWVLGGLDSVFYLPCTV